MDTRGRIPTVERGRKLGETKWRHAHFEHTLHEYARMQTRRQCIPMQWHPGSDSKNYLHTHEQALETQKHTHMFKSREDTQQAAHLWNQANSGSEIQLEVKLILSVHTVIHFMTASLFCTSYASSK